MTHRVLIVDDHRLFAETIRATLVDLGRHVVEIATRGDEAIEAVERDRPEVILLDLGLPDRSGFEVGVEILERWPDVRILVVTAMSDRRSASVALRNGFHGYLTKDAPVARFARAVESILDGQVVMPQGLTDLGYGPKGDDDHDAVRLRADQLTRRELDVLALMVAGVDGRGIAEELCISSNTVRTHAQSILTKLQVHSRLEAATFAVRHGIVAPPGMSTRSA
jgi:two-component system, NarL family, nitrate/nitrite response regulator NarL